MKQGGKRIPTNHVYDLFAADSCSFFGCFVRAGCFTEGTTEFDRANYKTQETNLQEAILLPRQEKQIC